MALLAGLRLPRPDRSNAGMWAIAGGHALNHTTLAAFSLLLPFIARDLGLSFSQVGLLVSVRQFMSVVVNIPAGVLVDVMGQRDRFMAVSLVGALLPYLIVALAPTLPVMVACMAVVGAAMFLWHPAAITTLSVLYPDRRGYGLALHEVGANAGMTLAPLAAGFLVATLTWRGVLVANVAAGLPLALFLLAVIARLQPAEGAGGQPARTLRGYAGNLRAMLRNPSFVVLAAVSGIRSMTQSGLSTFLPLYLVYTLGVPAPLLGVYLTILQVSGMVATPLSGTLSDRYGPKRVATAGMLVTSLVVLAVIAVRSATTFVAVLAPLGFFVYSMRPAIFRWALGVVPRDAEGATVGALFTAQALFSTFTPVLGGALADGYGLEAVFYFIAGTVLVANVATAMVPDLRRQ
ncbi:MAG: MFS transporter [Armatimonadota bacterium]|nr:MFS transporter [Armatimonadota bacterium]MDR7456061.1 MFS transporter [Armatimonadota bacterium]MDR7495377.1 MFS transporter [Armatimonadota bacterium]MDR7512020.1 MFS transporter [Armatimonadota bacterium]